MSKKNLENNSKFIKSIIYPLKNAKQFKMIEQLKKDGYLKKPESITISYENTSKIIKSNL